MTKKQTVLILGTKSRIIQIEGREPNYNCCGPFSQPFSVPMGRRDESESDMIFHDRMAMLEEIEYNIEDECDRCGSKTCYGHRECDLYNDVYIDEKESLLAQWSKIIVKD